MFQNLPSSNHREGSAKDYHFLKDSDMDSGSITISSSTGNVFGPLHSMRIPACFLGGREKASSGAADIQKLHR